MNEMFCKMFMLLFLIYHKYVKVEYILDMIGDMIEEVNKMKKIVKNVISLMCIMVKE